jgi:hypothetical protein
MTGERDKPGERGGEERRGAPLALAPPLVGVLGASACPTELDRLARRCLRICGTTPILGCRCLWGFEGRDGLFEQEIQEACRTDNDSGVETGVDELDNLNGTMVRLSV